MDRSIKGGAKERHEKARDYFIKQHNITFYDISMCERVQNVSEP